MLVIQRVFWCCRPAKSSSKHHLHLEAAEYDDAADVSLRGGERAEHSMTQVHFALLTNIIIVAYHPQSLSSATGQASVQSSSYLEGPRAPFMWRVHVAALPLL